MTRPFIPPARPLIGEEEISAVARVMRTGMIAQGPQVEAFEEEFARQIVPGTRAIALNSGTSALHLGLLAAGIGPGDEVIVPSFTFAATANAVAITGATPVFADIDPLTFTLSPASVSSAVSARTRAIMPVHLYGHPAPLDTLDAIARERGLMLFEDAAQAHGASLHGRPVGSFGTFAAFSFYPTKNMTSGEGGMVTSRDPALVRSGDGEREGHLGGLPRVDDAEEFGVANGAQEERPTDGPLRKLLHRLNDAHAGRHGVSGKVRAVDCVAGVGRQHIGASRRRLLAAADCE